MTKQKKKKNVNFFFSSNNFSVYICHTRFKNYYYVGPPLRRICIDSPRLCTYTYVYYRYPNNLMNKKKGRSKEILIQNSN